jgi:GTP-binding protein
MVIKNAKFIKSAAEPAHFYKSDKKQIAVVGKSNVGKSSFINMLAGNGKLARTSQTPGRTRLINYFDMGEFVLADLPGYGYAKAGKGEIEKWGALVESYLAGEERLARVLMLVDIRHEPTQLDLLLMDFLYKSMIPFSIIATKADKLAKSRVKPRLRELSAAFKVGEGDILAVSSHTGYGREETLRLIGNILNIGL